MRELTTKEVKYIIPHGKEGATEPSEEEKLIYLAWILQRNLHYPSIFRNFVIVEKLPGEGDK